MPRRFPVIAAAAAALFIAILGPVSTAQDPASTGSPGEQSSPSADPASTPEAPITPTEPAPTPTGSQEPQENTPAPDPEPTETAPPSADPLPEAGTPEPTAVAEAPVPSDAQSPSSFAEPAPAAPETTPTPKPSGRLRSRGGGRRAPNEESRKVKIQVRAPERKPPHDPGTRPLLRKPGGAPAQSNPTYSLATPGPARIGVPNFLIEKFRVPPFLLPIYQAAGTQYGVRWEVLAAINEIETDYGRNLNVSSAGALGWMQFMPATWRAYGVDANRDGAKDPYNPVDAIFAAARYLRASGAESDLRRAIFAYNHADWYVESVLMRARVVAGMPADLVGSLSGLTQGRFPVYAKATYASELTAAERRRRIRRGTNAAVLVESDGRRRGIRIYSRRGAPVIAVGDGRITAIGRSRRLGRYVKLRDAFGNTYTYARLGRISRTYPVPRKGSRRPRRDAATTSASPMRLRLPAGDRPNALIAGRRPLIGLSPARPVEFEVVTAPVGFKARDFRSRRLRVGSRVIGGTVLGRIGEGSRRSASRLLFEIRPAGRGAPRIDPKPILDGWKLLESTAIYRAAGRNPLLKPATGVGEILMMSKEQLVRRVMRNPDIAVGGCQREDIRTGQIDRRVLAALEFLAASGMRPTVSSLRCGRDYPTASGNVSEHTSGNAVDIAAINGISILGNQGPGSITEIAVQRLLKLQGTMKPHQIITLMQFDGADNTLAMTDHADHIHIGWRPLYGQSAKTARQIDALLRPNQWIKVIDRLGEIDNPEVHEEPSRYSVEVTKRPRSQERQR